MDVLWKMVKSIVKTIMHCRVYVLEDTLQGSPFAPLVTGVAIHVAARPGVDFHAAIQPLASIA